MFGLRKAASRLAEGGCAAAGVAMLLSMLAGLAFAAFCVALGALAYAGWRLQADAAAGIFAARRIRQRRTA